MPRLIIRVIYWRVLLGFSFHGAAKSRPTRPSQEGLEDRLPTGPALGVVIAVITGHHFLVDGSALLRVGHHWPGVTWAGIRGMIAAGEGV